MLRFLDYINMIRNKSDLKLCHSLIIGILIYLIFFFTVGQVINSWNSWNLSREVIRDRKRVYYRILLGTCCKYISVGRDRMKVLAVEFHVAARAAAWPVLRGPPVPLNTLPTRLGAGRGMPRSVCGLWCPGRLSVRAFESLCRSQTRPVLSQSSQVLLDTGRFGEEVFFAWVSSLLLISRKAKPTQERALRMVLH